MSLLMLLAAALMQVRRLGVLPSQGLVLGVISVGRLSHPKLCPAHCSLAIFFSLSGDFL